MNISDSTAISGLMSGLGYPCTADQMEVRLQAFSDDPAHATFVASIDDRLVGMTGAFVGHIYEQDEPVGRIIALVVDEKSRGTGVGKSLVQTAEDWIVSRGGSTVLLNSGIHRPNAHIFYEKSGYSTKGLSFARRLK